MTAHDYSVEIQESTGQLTILGSPEVSVIEVSQGQPVIVEIVSQGPQGNPGVIVIGSTASTPPAGTATGTIVYKLLS